MKIIEGANPGICAYGSAYFYIVIYEREMGSNHKTPKQDSNEENIKLIN